MKSRAGKKASKDSRVIFLEGDSIYLRPLEMDDLPRVYRWINDPDTRVSIGQGFFPKTETDERKYLETVSNSPEAVKMAIVVKKSNQHIGVCGLHAIQWQDRCAEFGILIGEVDSRGKGYGTEATRLTVAYAFETLNLHRVQLGVLDFNSGGIVAYEKVGFIREGLERKRCYREGKYHDHLLYGLLAEEYFNK